MENESIAALFLLAFSILFVFRPSMVSGQFELEESRLFSIQVYTNGSAAYVFRRIFILVTEDDMTVFEQYLSDFETIKEGLLERFSNETRFMVNRTSSITNRTMDAINFNVSAYMLQTITGFRGIIEYKFFWIGFAFVERGEIHVGDVFEVGLVLLEKDELNICYPEGYSVADVEPDPDNIRDKDRVLIWIGPKAFVSGTPVIALTMETSSFFDNLQTYGLVIGLVVLGASFFAVFYRFRREKKREEKLKHIPLAILEVESEEDKIIKLLQGSGGYSGQSAIAEKLGMSKSKASETLSNMEKKGLIKRQKKGREKIVVLLEQQNDR